MQIPNFIEQFTFTDLNYLNKIFSAFLIIIILWVVRYAILKIVYHQTSNINSRYSWRKFTFYILVLLAVILVGRHWFNGLEPILAFLGIIAAALTISLKEVVLNFAGMLVILWRNVLVVGDRIQIAEHKGDVVGIGAAYFSVLEIGNWVDAEQSTGRLIKVPNSLVLSNPVINYTKSFPFIWDEISIGITFESNWKKARTIMEKVALQQTEGKVEIVRKHLRQLEDELIHFQHLNPKVYIKPDTVTLFGMILTLRYLCEPRKRRDTENDLWEEILTKFEADPEIELLKK